MPYRVKEIYYTLQGEGAQTGRPAVFLRFAGCNLWTGREEDRDDAICPFCDTDFLGVDGGRQSQRLAKRMREADMRDDPVAEERGVAVEGAVDELIGEHEIERLDLLPQAPDRARRDDGFDAELLEAVDIGAEVQLRRQQPVSVAVPASAAMHALTVGAIGTMILAVMTRATLGHTGRPLRADGVTVSIYGLITAAALLRLASPLAGAHGVLVTSLAGAAWTAAFATFAVHYGRILFSRARPG